MWAGRQGCLGFTASWVEAMDLLTPPQAREPPRPGLAWLSLPWPGVEPASPPHSGSDFGLRDAGFEGPRDLRRFESKRFKLHR